jgi:20S proteasome subunit beta 2
VRKLFPDRGYLSAALILGGVDFKGPVVYDIAPIGYVANPPFAATGSGGAAATAVLENGWKRDLSLEEAKGLIANGWRTTWDRDRDRM